MTEDEAKTKWCCGFGSGAHSENAHCIASACMAWRWSHMIDDPAGQHPHTWPDVARYHDKDTARRFIRPGFCGLAGNPEA